MKTTHRSIPNDMLSVEEGNRHIQISAFRRNIVITLSEDGIIRSSEPFFFEEMYEVLQALLTGRPVPPPSQDDKEAATAPQGAEKGVL